MSEGNRQKSFDFELNYIYYNYNYIFHKFYLDRSWILCLISSGQTSRVSWTTISYYVREQKWYQKLQLWL